MPNGKNVDNALKINDYGKTLSFCKYLRDKSSDLYEILNLSSYDSNKLPTNILRRFVHAHARTKCTPVQKQSNVHVCI